MQSLTISSNRSRHFASSSVQYLPSKFCSWSSTTVLTDRKLFEHGTWKLNHAQITYEICFCLPRLFGTLVSSKSGIRNAVSSSSSSKWSSRVKSSHPEIEAAISGNSAGICCRSRTNASFSSSLCARSSLSSLSVNFFRYSRISLKGSLRAGGGAVASL